MFLLLAFVTHALFCYVMGWKHHLRSLYNLGHRRQELAQNTVNVIVLSSVTSSQHIPKTQNRQHSR